ncbi:MAG TPA: Stk1 family PASTA domain-containing Ser/Thr kinase [Actinomycetota bacterium]
MSKNVLGGRYELSERLGVGGMAEVYLGKDRVLGRTVAVKTLLIQFAHDPSFIARFRREATSAAALNHPNIVGVYDSGSDDGQHYIVMEYVEGRTLKDLIREEGPLLPERAAELAADVCGALQFAHAHGIIHRDVKPANIMINARGEVKVADFGIARAASGETVTQTATVLGTAQYFSPEQAQAGSVDARSDLYSLGIVLYEMMTRQVPFTGASPVAIAYKHVKEDPIPPSRLNADVTPEIEAIVMKALSKNPDNRYQSAQEMRQDLERAIRGQAVSAPRVMAGETSVMTAPGSGDETVILRGPAAPQRSGRGTGIALLAVIAAAMIGIIIWALLALLPKSPNTVAVPGVEGFTVEAAENRLQDAGFKTVVGDGVPSDQIEEGLVLRTDPRAGERLARGGTVTIIPSSGLERVKVPKVTGLQQAAAEKALDDAGLSVAVVQGTSDTAAQGVVIAQSPPPDEEVVAGTTVTITVSSGKGTAFVPNVEGLTEQVAIQRIRERGLVERIEREAPSGSCPQPSGRVCRQSPSGGEQVERGSTVTIVVADEPEIPPPTEEPTPTDSPSP